MYDVVIIGAGFSGLTLAMHLPQNLKVLIVDRKPRLDLSYESTGLITVRTKELLETFIPNLQKFIPNAIDTLGVVGPDFKQNFFSTSKAPWIYSTDTPKLIDYISKNLPDNVELKTNTSFVKTNHKCGKCQIELQEGDRKFQVESKFLVGADGAKSTVAEKVKGLSQNKKYLFGLEKVFFGDITYGDNPDSTVYHYWFGEFSLGYGGWLSPTLIEGKKAFRLGIAKLAKDVSGIRKLNEFIKILEEKKMIKINASNKKQREVSSYGDYIPLGGPLKNLYSHNTLLVGDAGGFCGPFAADGIKGSIVSAKVSARLISEFLEIKDEKIFKQYKKKINKYEKLIKYYFKQKLYRLVWNQMRRNRTYCEMIKMISQNKDGFISQFSDAKNNGGDLTKLVLSPKTFPYLIKYGVYFLIDLIVR